MLGSKLNGGGGGGGLVPTGGPNSKGVFPCSILSIGIGLISGAGLTDFGSEDAGATNGRGGGYRRSSGTLEAQI